MTELYKTNRLTIIVIAIVLVIVVGLISVKRPEVKYVLSPVESLALLNDTSVLVTPNQAAELLKDSAGKTIFIDVRNSIAFDKSHVKNAINIPIRELFTKKSRYVFQDREKAGQNAILYGETQQQANGPWLMLRQTGFKNVFLFTGCYAQMDVSHTDSLAKLLPQLSETPLIDTTALKALTSPSANKNSITLTQKTEKKTVAPVKKAASSGGGC